MNPVSTPVDTYIAMQAARVQPALRQIREAICSALPAAEESISYNMPVYTLEGRRVLFFAAWKEHVALYLASQSVLAAVAAEPGRCVIGKGTIRFPLAKPMPIRLVRRIAKLRAQEVLSPPHAAAGRRE